MRLRFKILAGFLILALMLSLAGAWSIHELHSSSFKVQDLLSENYESIHSGKTMLEALEREDSGVLLLMLGRWSEGRGILASADSLFQKSFNVAAGNVTIPGEEEHIEAIRTKYAAFKGIWEKPITNTEREGNLSWYFERANRSFLETKAAVNGLIVMNDQVMFETAEGMNRAADRAVMPGIVAIVAALAFSLMFSYFVNLYMVSPIIRITAGVLAFLKDESPFTVVVRTKDELGQLAEAIDRLITHDRMHLHPPVEEPES